MTKAQEIVKDLRTKKLDVTLLSEESSPCVITDWMSTGCLALDAILGGGLPVGRVTEIYGDPSTGKSLIAAQVAALVQQEGGLVVYADTETAISLDMMKEIGVDTDEMIYASPDTVEEIFDLFESTIDSRKKYAKDSMLLLIWDSVAATSTHYEMEKAYGDATMATHARMISQGLRKITRKISKEKVCILLLNQTRTKMGVMFGDKTSTLGGKAVSFHSSMRVKLDITSKISIPSKQGKKKKIIGMDTEATCVKNKVAVPFRSCRLPIYFGHGIDDAKASLCFLEDNGLVTGSGQWKVITISGKEVKFQKKTWQDTFDKHYDAIADMILAFDEEGIADEEEVGDGG